MTVLERAATTLGFVVVACTPDASTVVAMTADGLQWRRVDERSSTAPLYGDPGGRGPWGARYRLAPGWEAAPHMHGAMEVITVQTGTFYLAYGEDLRRDAAKAYGPGSVIALPAGTKMYAFIGASEATIDIQGPGPLTTHPLHQEGSEWR